LLRLSLSSAKSKIVFSLCEEPLRTLNEMQFASRTIESWLRLVAQRINGLFRGPTARLSPSNAKIKIVLSLLHVPLRTLN
jgi:hypothetical protein